jgi:hypothetical protein
MPSISIRQCGWRAAEIFQQNARLKSLGATSKAVYLISKSGQVIILSFDSYISPLTCTLDHFSPELRAITPGEEFTISDSALVHPTVTVLLRSSAIWHEPFPTGDPLPAAACLRLATQAAEFFTHQKSSVGFASLLLPVLHLEPPVSDGVNIYAHIMELLGALTAGSATQAGQAILPLLGLGRGLTPSGDDLINGLLLFQNRWPAYSPLANSDQVLFNQQVIFQSRQRTTSLSANLLELAALGTGDERLISAVDGLATGQPPLPQWLPALSSYGSSSGGDALLGMALAILSSSK